MFSIADHVNYTLKSEFKRSIKGVFIIFKFKKRVDTMYNYTLPMPKYVTDYTMYVSQILKRRRYRERRRKKRGKSRR